MAPPPPPAGAMQESHASTGARRDPRPFMLVVGGGQLPWAVVAFACGLWSMDSWLVYCPLSARASSVVVGIGFARATPPTADSASATAMDSVSFEDIFVLLFSAAIFGVR